MPRLPAWLLTLALLWAQLAAGVHALEHLHDTDDPEHPPCEWCLAYGAIQHGATGKPLLPIAAGRPFDLPQPVLSGASSPFSPHYHSRAPPISLA